MLLLYDCLHFTDFPTHCQFELEEEREDDIETVIAATPAHSIMEPPNGVTMESVKNSSNQPPEPQAVQDDQRSLNETHILKVSRKVGINVANILTLMAVKLQ